MEIHLNTSFVLNTLNDEERMKKETKWENDINVYHHLNKKELTDEEKKGSNQYVNI